MNVLVEITKIKQKSLKVQCTIVGTPVRKRAIQYVGVYRNNKEIKDISIVAQFLGIDYRPKTQYWIKDKP